MPSSQSNKDSSNQGTSGSGSKNPLSKYRVIKDGWGSRPNFQASYGLGMDPDGIEEGNAILDAIMEQDYGTQSKGSSKK